MEAAEEAARQLRLRDLAGLIVIDFIDMDEAKNNRAVEKKLKDCLKDDRARVQMGKISPFGLMEISRQRRRTGVLEGTTHVCEHCGGTGRVRSVESSALAALRALEIEALKGGGEACLTVPRAVGLYILNEKRGHLARLQQNFGLFVTVLIDDDMGQADHGIERTASETRPDHAAAIAHAPTPAYEPLADDGFDDEAFEDEEEEDEEELEGDEEAEAAEPRRARDEDSHDEGEGRRGRRRRRRGRRGDEREAREPREPREAREAREGAPQPEAREDEDDGHGGRRRRRGRRGGRRMRDDARPHDAFAWTRPWVPYGDDPFVWYDPSEDMRRAQAPSPAPVAANDVRPPAPAAAAEAAPPAPSVTPAAAAASDEDIWVELPAVEDKPKRPRRGRGRGKAEAVEAPAVTDAEAGTEAAAPAPQPAPEPEATPVEAAPVEAIAEAKPARAPRSRRKAPAAAQAPAAAEAAVAEPAVAPVPPATPAAPGPAAEPERVAEPAPAPVAAEPDPTQISAPPAAPRRGWWRRG
jgi:ribonuclease E